LVEREERMSKSKSKYANPVIGQESLGVGQGSTYIIRFVYWWLGTAAAISAIALVARGTMLAIDTFGPGVIAFAICVMVCTIIAAIAAI